MDSAREDVVQADGSVPDGRHDAGWARDVTVTCRKNRLDRMTAGGRGGPRSPAVSLFRVVAGLAEPLAVVETGGPVLAVGDHVVGVPDGRLAPRRTADLVAESDEPGESTREASAPRVAGDQLASRGVGIEAMQPHRLTTAAGARHQLSRELGWDLAESGEVGRVVAASEEVV